MGSPESTCDIVVYRESLGLCVIFREVEKVELCCCFLVGSGVCVHCLPFGWLKTEAYFFRLVNQEEER